jgi:hypothetical protein
MITTAFSLNMEERAAGLVSVMGRINGSDYVLLQATSREEANAFASKIPDHLIDAAQRAQLSEEISGLTWLPETIDPGETVHVDAKIAAAVVDLTSFAR